MNRRFEVLIIPALLLAAIALPIPLLADRLPDPIATHWGLDGSPDGSGDPTVLWLVATGVWVALWAGLAWRARKGGPLPEAVPVLAAGGFLAALMLVTVAANDGAASWREADDVGWPAVLASLAAGALLAGVAHLLERGQEHPATGLSPGEATIGLGEVEHAVWVGHASSTRMALGGSLGALALAAGGLLVEGAAGWILVASAVVVAIALTWVAMVRVTASERGLRIAFGPFGFPSKHMPSSGSSAPRRPRSSRCDGAAGATAGPVPGVRRWWSGAVPGSCSTCAAAAASRSPSTSRRLPPVS